MADGTKIEWARHPVTGAGASWNPIRARNLETGKIGHFCVHVSEGCRNCYAERWQPRFGNPVRFVEQDRKKVEIFVDAKALFQPLHWKKPRGIFVCDMSDLFDKGVSDDMIDMVFAVMALTPQHIYFVLTKRPARMREYLSDPKVVRRTYELACNMAIAHDVKFIWPIPNVWLGTSAEDQTTADERIPRLLATPAAKRFVSLEPLLGPVYVSERIDWVIAGGESGPKARPSHPDWFRSLRDQCATAGVPFFFKQWGEWIDADELWPSGPPLTFLGAQELAEFEGYQFQPQSSGHTMVRVGKRQAGRTLDGKTHDAMPALANRGAGGGE
ncbi:MAG: phage Gp37/Gp68 family protein [Hyphomicrobiaceae bacterium]|nr:phage Gp37/Gp68 family protein [Hyphomicrobiaceae bacterium]